MKKAALFATILALALGASAESVNFGALPAVSNPTLLPNGYSNLDWSGFYYVDPIWSGAGVGFKQGPNSLDVAYMGGGHCEKAGVSCSASISSNAASANAAAGFKAQSAIVAAGYHSETINVSAYKQGQFVGSQNYNLSTSLQQINFPAGWGMITQLVMDTNSGTLVLYALNMQSVGATAQGAASASEAGAAASDNSVGPTAPIRVIDPPPPGNKQVSSAGELPICGLWPFYCYKHHKRPGPVAHESENTIADDRGTVTPPIIVIGPNAPKKKPRPVAHEAENTIADSRSITGVPPIVVLPTAPRKPRPVAHEAENTIADSRSITGVPPIAIPPTAPKKPSPVPRESENLIAGDHGGVPPIAIPPTAPKKPGPVARESENTIADRGVVSPPIIVIGPSAPKKPGKVAHESESASA
jgi:hypothetical protein